MDLSNVETFFLRLRNVLAVCERTEVQTAGQVRELTERLAANETVRAEFLQCESCPWRRFCDKAEFAAG